MLFLDADRESFVEFNSRSILSIVLNTENEKCIQSSFTMEILPKKRKFYPQDQGETENGVVQENDLERHFTRILPMSTGSGLSDNLSIISKQESK